MLEVTTPAEEITLGVEFTTAYKNSDLYKYVQCYINCIIRLQKKKKKTYHLGNV